MSLKYPEKSFKRRILESLLRKMAVVVLRKYRPRIVGITGSVGKTSTKEAIALLLGERFSIRKNESNYNNEVGIPLTIIGARSGGGSLLRWMGVLLRWARLILHRETYPDILVLEMGIDRPGDMEYLLSFLSVEIGVLTNVSGSHLEYFGTITTLAKEKGFLLTQLPKNGVAIANADNAQVARVLKKTKAQTVITYGFSESVTLRAESVHWQDSAFDGILFRLRYQGKVLPVRLPQVVAQHHIPAVLAALSVGLAFKLNLVEMTQSLSKFRLLPGRMRPLEGVNEGVLIDDTYNASPTSLESALQTIQSLRATRRIAIIGDMLELGSGSEREHAKVAEWLKTYGIDRVIFVGTRMRKAYDELLKADWQESQVWWLESPVRAGEIARQWIVPGDIVLCKGSQGMRMELAVEMLLARPEQAGELLCRQTPEWKRTPFRVV
jgi:UDP-N-acetylmuramyl pentapeptide synthase